MDAKVKPASRDSILRAFGENLKAIRESKGLTQEALAYMSGFSRSYYTEVEQGKRNPSLVNISRLADALEVSLSNLLSY